jgi:hypothetical protein
MTFISRASHLKRASAAAVVSCAAFLSAACTGEVSSDNPSGPGVGGSGSTSVGGRGASVGGGPAAGAAVGNPQGGNGTAGNGTPPSGVGGSAGAGASGPGSGGSASSVPRTTGGSSLRLLTKPEYLAALKSLFGTLTTPLEPPDDTSVGGFIAIGAATNSVNPTGVDAYEVTSRAVVAEVFGDKARWQGLVACTPQENLSDACVETFVKTFGKKAFRRALTDAETQQWVKVGRDAAALAGTAAHGLSTVISGFLQSPNFLYRVETTALDVSIDRLKYDGRTMADRLAFFLTGAPPTAELVAAAESGKLDTAEGVRTAAMGMLNDPGLVSRLTGFFYEWGQLDLVMTAEKNPDMFPNFSESLRNSMREGARLFLEKVVLAPGADMRALFDSNQTFADAALAPYYGVAPPASGFAQFTVPAEQKRAGIMGQVGMITAHSKPDHSSPTARGVFMLRNFLCTIPPPPPPGVLTELKVDPTLTTRQRLELHRSDPLCANCHALFDPMGMALEHFDSVGKYREMEGGHAVDASGTFLDAQKSPFNGLAELGAIMRNDPAVMECLLRYFYRNVNARQDDKYDESQIDGMAASLSSRGYVFRDMIADLVVSDAFRSAPRVPLAPEM